MRRPSGEARRLLAIALRRPSFVDRLRGASPRREALRALAALGEPAIIPELLPLVATEGADALAAGRTIATLWPAVGPADLAWIDDQARRGWHGGDVGHAWRNLRPTAVPRLASTHGGEPSVVGLLGCHPSGYVREAAIKELRAVTDGREISFLALRANDWVWPVAERAAELLTGRLVAENRVAVLAAFPFLVRMAAQQRRDHRGLIGVMRDVLVSDGGEALLGRLASFDARARRVAFGMLPSGDRRVVDAALGDADPIVRLRVIDGLAGPAGGDAGLAIVERVATRDPAPAVRARALGVLAERMPTRAAALVPDALLDVGAAVRTLARFLVTKLGVAVVPRERYVAALDSRAPRRLAAAIDGLGELRVAPDADRVVAFVDHPLPRVRRAALTALGRLAPPRGIAPATAALTDAAPSVRRVARRLLIGQRARVDFGGVRDRSRASGEATLRREILAVLAYAPKWDAAAFLLEALDDPDGAVGARATALIEAWTDTFHRSQFQPGREQLERVRASFERHAPRLPSRTARLLRFTLDTTTAAPR